jgi:hypothetical protein
MRRWVAPFRLLHVLLGCWIVASVLGFLVLEAHNIRQGDRGNPPTSWPHGTALTLDKSRPTLLIFLHPHCPCSRASLDELAWVMSRCRGRVSPIAVVYHPAQPSDEWLRSGPGIERDLIDQPELPFCYDTNGTEARRFGIATSGHVLLFDTQGQRIFEGGITFSRGHRGVNRGREELLAQILSMKLPAKPSSGSAPPVFGCPLFTTDATREEGS